MERTYSVVILFICNVILATRSFNVDTTFPIVASMPDDSFSSSDAQFGYTVALVAEGDTSWLFVGAPRANSTLSSFFNVHQPGVAFRCPLKENGYGDLPCSPMDLDDKGNRAHGSGISMNIRCLHGDSVCDFKDGAAIGSTIAVSPPNGVTPRRVAICGSRWSNHRHQDYYLMNGVCYWQNANGSISKNANKLTPLISLDDQSYKVEVPGKPVRDYFYYAYGQAGFSAQFANDGSELLLGAPGVMDWTGTIVRYKDRGDFAIGGRQRRSVDYPLEALTVPNPYRADKYIGINNYTGYAIGSGHFFNKNVTHYVLGAPRGEKMFGKIIICNITVEYRLSLLQVQKQIIGDQFASYYGSVIAVIDINNDGWDELFVGSPLHRLEPNLYDEGKVYVYRNNGGSLEKAKSLYGQKLARGARFGSAIASAGDIDADGVKDVLVGAPYEDDQGAVYIFLGRPDVSFKRTQKITPSGLNLGITLRGFGISLSSNEDVDRNGYNDVAVGAYDSGNAVIFRSRPVIRFRPQLLLDKDKMHLNETEIKAACCIMFHGKDLPDTVDINVRLRLDAAVMSPRIYVEVEGTKTSDHQFRMQLVRESYTCTNFTVQMVEKINNVFQQIRLEMFYTFEDVMETFTNTEPIFLGSANNTDGFCKSCPVVSPSVNNKVEQSVTILTGCKSNGDDICNADLSLEWSITELRNDEPLIIGTRSTLNVNVNVTNHGENAFLTWLNINMSDLISVKRVPRNCKLLSSEGGETERNNLTCDLPIYNPLGSGMQTGMSLELDVSKLESGTENFVILLETGSASREKDEQLHDNKADVNVPLKTVGGLTIAGLPSRDNNITLREDRPQTVLLHHIYEVVQLGPSRLFEADLLFSFPVNYTLTHKEVSKEFAFAEIVEATVSVDGKNMPCDISDSELADTCLQSGQAVGTREESLGVRPNITAFLNCSDSRVSCAQILCRAVNLERDFLLTFSFQALIKSEEILPFVGGKSLILLASSGRTCAVQPANALLSQSERPGDIFAWTVLPVAKEPESVQWIVIVSSSAGLLVLCLLIIPGLIMSGFFERSQRDKLEELKQQNEVSSLTEYDSNGEGLDNNAFHRESQEMHVQEGTTG